MHVRYDRPVSRSAFLARRLALFSLVMLLIVVLVFIILDLDRPRRGLVRVDHGSLVSLQTQLQRP